MHPVCRAYYSVCRSVCCFGFPFSTVCVGVIEVGVVLDVCEQQSLILGLNFRTDYALGSMLNSESKLYGMSSVNFTQIA